MSAPWLPPEIISVIVDYVAVAGKGPWKNLKRDLKACSLTSRLLVSFARPYLFASMSISTKKAVKRKIDLQNEWFPIAPYVRALKLTCSDEDKQVGVSPLTTMISVLGDLRSFCFQFDTKGGSTWHRLPLPLLHEIRTLLLRSQKLNRFETDMIAFPLGQLIATDLQSLILRPTFKACRFYSIFPMEREHRLEQVPCLKALDLSGYYELTLGDILHQPEWINLTQLETVIVVIDNGFQHSLVQELLSQTQALKVVKMALQCEIDDGNYPSVYPVPLKAFHSSCWDTLQHLGLDLYIQVADHIPETWDAQYFGLTSNDSDEPLSLPTLLSFSALASLKLTIHLSGDLVVMESWRELDTLFLHSDALPHLPNANSLWSDGITREDAQLLFDDLDPWFFNSKTGCFKNIWKRARDQGQGGFKFKPSVRVNEEVEAIPIRCYLGAGINTPLGKYPVSHFGRDLGKKGVYNCRGME
ncbi:hypothetical protein BKA70DRAFT_1240664 [Coprinopsis sp. MPI-PUGE-AT-0042]|nr:hypothetical protein BKA70DRAFT_1240664 [Coprinopsis sp. MPI-PUGE-AT-0042]